MYYLKTERGLRSVTFDWPARECVFADGTQISQETFVERGYELIVEEGRYAADVHRNEQDPANTCTCEMHTLMAHGCQCGGE